MERGDADLIAFGRHFLANPDLPRPHPPRVAAQRRTTRSTFYTFDARGYTDYPVYHGTGAGPVLDGGPEDRRETETGRTERSSLNESMIDAWVAPAAQREIESGSRSTWARLGPEEVEVAVEHCGLCHSDVSVLNDEWGMSRYPAVLGPRGDRHGGGGRADQSGA